MTFKTSTSKRPMPVIGTSSLPDIIFMLLFFFLVVTVLRDTTIKVKTQLPKVTELNYLHNRDLINHIYVGPVIGNEENKRIAIQINDVFINPSEMERSLFRLLDAKPKDLQAQVINSLHIDESVTMGIVTELKTALRKTRQLKVNYAAMSKPL